MTRRRDIREQRREAEEQKWLALRDALEDEDEQGPEMTPEPQVDPYHGDHYHTMPGFGPRRMK